MTRIAMWSGPRNISTAMMRSFGTRADTFVTDEPLYAHYLAATGLDHPGRDDVIASQPTDWRIVAQQLTGPIPDGRAIWYQKHMTHHMLDAIDLDWLGTLRHAYLIRDPARVVASYAKVREAPTLADLGFTQQAVLFARFPGPVVDTDDLLRNPAGVLRKLCEAIAIPWDEAMLSWPAGRRDTDGVWAPHWYAAVERSTGFASPDDRPRTVPAELQPLVDAARPYYEALRSSPMAVGGTGDR